MSRRWVVMAAAALLGIACGLGWIIWQQAGKENPLVAEIERLGGTAWQDETDPQRPVVAINFTGANLSDASLESLEDLTRLRRLYLSGTRISDKGLTCLEGLTHLEELYLLAVPITDAGMKSIGKMTSLRRLDLSATGVTDRGLEQLKRLKQLQTLDLADTRVTAAGIQALQQALPEVEIRLTTF